MIKKIKIFVMGVAEYFDTEVSFKRSTVLLVLSILYGCSFAHQIRYECFSPMLYMWLLLMLLAYLVIYGKPVNKN